MVKKNVVISFAVLALLMIAAENAFASSSTGLPWEGWLTQILDSIQGPVARVIGAVAIMGLGFGLASSEGGSMMKKALWVGMGLTIAFNATSWGLSFFGYAGGLLV